MGYVKKKKLITRFQSLVLKWGNGARFKKAPFVDINYLYGLQIVIVVYFKNINASGELSQITIKIIPLDYFGYNVILSS